MKIKEAINLIARIWSGKTAEKDAEAYHRYLLETGIKEYWESL